MNNPFLEGKKIYLSPLSLQDITDKYIGWLNNKEVCRENSHGVFPNTKAKTIAYVKGLENSKSEMAFAIRWKKNDAHVGNAAINRIDPVNRSADLAIMIGDKKYWGKGIGSEVYALLLDHGFNALNLNRISSGQTVTNKGMIKVCEKMGMKKEGILREALYKEGRYVDAVIFSILKKDFIRINTK